jgi:hypothetical protein
LRRLTVPLTITAAGAMAATGTAQAAPSVTLSPVKPCYLSGETVNLALAGFTPNGPVAVKLDDRTVGTASVDPTGSTASTFTFGRMRGATSHALTATDGTNPALIASTSFQGTTNMVNVRPKRARAGVRLRLRGFGFLAGPRVYMHVRGHGYKSDRRVGRARGPCGTFAARTRIVPTNARSGRYRVQFDARRRYSKRTKPKVVGTMTVTRRVRSSAARVAVAWSR